MNEVTDARASVTSLFLQRRQGEKKREGRCTDGCVPAYPAICAGPTAYFNYCIFAEESKRRVKSRMTVTRLKHPVSSCFTSVTVCNVC